MAHGLQFPARRFTTEEALMRYGVSTYAIGALLGGVLLAACNASSGDEAVGGSEQALRRHRCTKTTCSAQGANCGSVSDGCGGTLNCGSCASPQTCGGGGTPNTCGGGT